MWRVGCGGQDGLGVLYLGIFATVWFSVPAAEQPLRGALMAGSVAALLTAIGGGIVTARSRGADAGDELHIPRVTPHAGRHPRAGPLVD
ncbi:hypothetical protein C1I99_19125 [Micromonospora deserti]|uniref:Uncharacterized protein n=1 Tax=Micromonospora deserti TaxID=2070366 RepID=A0A2W2D1Y2_9ACTN|nr:hypothetical protein C1I99_19125 [Micromonospora deserti]